MKKEKFSNDIQIKNRRASFEYQFLETYCAGIMLSGTEIKSVREGEVNLSDAFCLFESDELWVRQMHISKYKMGTHYNHEPVHDRKLLLTKRELKKLNKNSQEKGLTIIPIRMFINERGFAKLEIALAKGKKLYDKREDLKEKDTKRELERIKF